MWTPLVHDRFPGLFRNAVFKLLCCHHVLARQPGPNFGKVPTDILYRILNSIPHDWFGEDESLQHALLLDDDDESEESDYALEQQDFVFGGRELDQYRRFASDEDDEDEDEDEDDDDDDDDEDYEDEGETD